MESQPTEKTQSSYLLPASILIAGVLIAGSVLYATGRNGSLTLSQSQPGQVAQPTQPVDNQLANLTANVPSLGSRDAVMGDPTAPIIFIEYGDYQCPFCGRFFNSVEPKIITDYVKTGKVKLAFRNFIVNDRAPQNHESHWAAEAAECAKDQNKFWEFRDALFQVEVKDGVENNGNLSRDLFLQIAANLRMDVGRFEQCFDLHKYASTVQKESDEAAAGGISATPTSVINGRKIEGALPYDQFSSLIDNLLKTK